MGVRFRSTVKLHDRRSLWEWRQRIAAPASPQPVSIRLGGAETGNNDPQADVPVSSPPVFMLKDRSPRSSHECRGPIGVKDETAAAGLASNSAG